MSLERFTPDDVPFSLLSLIPHILCRPIKHGRNRGIGRGGEGQRRDERDTVRGCLNTEGVQSGVFAAPRE